MFCNKCGNEIKDGVRFCTSCGAPVQNASPVNSPESNFGSETVKLDYTPEQIMPQSGEHGTVLLNTDTGFNPYGNAPRPDFSDDIAISRDNNRKKSGVGKTVFLISLITVLVALIATCIYLIVSGKVLDIPYIGEFIEEHTNISRETTDDDDDGRKDDRKKPGKSDNDQDDGSDVQTDTEDSEPDERTAQPQDIDIYIRQVDNSNFPEVVFYAGITDKNGQSVPDMKREDFEITEIDANGNVQPVTIDKVNQVIASNEKICMQLVLDASSSMNSYSKLDKSKYAAQALVDKLGERVTDRVSIITFDDYVYLNQDFTPDKNSLKAAIDAIYANGNTALYDGIYAGITQTYYQNGVRCVIALTDGAENASSYTFDDVVNLARQTGIPVYIIGVGDYSYDSTELKELAQQCSGRYYSADEQELDTILEDIYVGIYEEQQDYYTFTYTSNNTADLSDYRRIRLTTTEECIYRGEYEKEYVPESDVSGAFSDSYADMDFMLDFSSDREVTASDLEGMTLAQLRIARNEIFARHGRQFNDAFLNQWFYSKTWYLSLPQKYSPDYFDANKPNPLTKLENQNVTFIHDYEQAKMEYEDIFPSAANSLLSEYDLNLSKENLKKALEQVQTYPSTQIRDENIRLIQEAIDRDDIEY